MCTSSNFPFSITRTSSGESKRFRMVLISLLLIGARCVIERTQPRIWHVQLCRWASFAQGYGVAGARNDKEVREREAHSSAREARALPRIKRVRRRVRREEEELRDRPRPGAAVFRAAFFRLKPV